MVTNDNAQTFKSALHRKALKKNKRSRGQGQSAAREATRSRKKRSESSRAGLTREGDSTPFCRRSSSHMSRLSGLEPPRCTGRRVLAPVPYPRSGPAAARAQGAGV
ncbi:hypothetical protein EYF80_053307 [Liparis tanakae]|uniref:Uncharacterized protein n=1 Tax=Liparis tanakae TaxID=230148 RepID=A0A4Z2F6P4_9TELE|nr:hypothetical protein EYF80_053307 [Liparis tanakae]